MYILGNLLAYIFVLHHFKVGLSNRKTHYQNNITNPIKLDVHPKTNYNYNSMWKQSCTDLEIIRRFDLKAFSIP